MNKKYLGIGALIIVVVGLFFSVVLPVKYVDMHATDFYWKTQYSVLTYQKVVDQGKEVPEGATVTSKRTEYDKSKCISPDSCNGDAYILYTFEYMDWVTSRYVTLDNHDQNVIEPTAQLANGEKLDEDSLETLMQVYFEDSAGNTYQKLVYDQARFVSFKEDEVYVGGFNIWGALISVK